jgi:hypothetical protein
LVSAQYCDTRLDDLEVMVWVWVVICDTRVSAVPSTRGDARRSKLPFLQGRAGT